MVAMGDADGFVGGAANTTAETVRAVLHAIGTAPGVKTVSSVFVMAVQNPAMVELGRSLFFDKILSGNRDVSCATCHDPAAALTDGMRIAVGTGGTGATAQRTLGAGRQFVPRNAPSLLNQGLGFFYLFWDGRVNEEGGPGRSPFL